MKLSREILSDALEEFYKTGELRFPIYHLCKMALCAHDMAEALELHSTRDSTFEDRKEQALKKWGEL